MADNPSSRLYIVGIVRYYFQYGRNPQIIRNAGMNKKLHAIMAVINPSISAPTYIAILNIGPGKHDTRENPYF